MLGLGYVIFKIFQVKALMVIYKKNQQPPRNPPKTEVFIFLSLFLSYIHKLNMS